MTRRAIPPPRGRVAREATADGVALESLPTRLALAIARAPPSPNGEGCAPRARAVFRCGLAASRPRKTTIPRAPITLIVPYAAGGSIDLVARIVAEGLTARLGQTVVVDDKPGGNGVIGIREAVKAQARRLHAADGLGRRQRHAGAVQKDYPFDPLKDYVPIAMVAEWSAILVVKKDLPVNTLAEFVAYAKARPGAAQLRRHRLWQLRPSGQRGVHAADRHRDAARAVQGRLAGDHRPAGRHDRRAHDELGGRRRPG